MSRRRRSYDVQSLIPLRGLERQGLAHTLSGRLFGGALGEDTTLTPMSPSLQPDYMTLLTKIDKQTQEAVAKLDEQEKNRKIALVIAGASALFAAVKLGIIAFPHLKARVSKSGTQP